MDLQFWKTLSNVVLALGIGLSALGTFGAYYFSNRLDRRREDAGTENARADAAERTRLNGQIDRLVEGNDELRTRLLPFEEFAKRRYPGVEHREALEKLENEMSTLGSRAAELEKQVRGADPRLQPIRAASATVEVLVKSDAQVDTTYMDSGGMFVLGAGNNSVLLTAGHQASARQLGDGTVLYRGVWPMDASDMAVGQPVHSLRAAEYAQIMFGQMPVGCTVLRGSVRLTVNSSIQLDFTIPGQVAQDRNVFIREVAKALSRLTPPE